MNAFFAEFFGTAMIIVFGGGVVSNVLLNKTKGNNMLVPALQIHKPNYL